MNYKHKLNQIDPRDRHLVSYDADNKRFTVEASDLKGYGIEPEWHRGVISSYYYLWMWSERLQRSILYILTGRVRNTDNEVIADVFTPRFDSISSQTDVEAYTLSAGTELHILAD